MIANMPAKIEPIGQVSIDVLRELLDGKREFSQTIMEIRAGNLGDAVIDTNLPVALLFKRYTPTPTCLKVTRRCNWNRPQPAIELSLDSKDNKAVRWIAKPFLLTVKHFDEEDRFSVSIPESWVTLLLDYVEQEFRAIKKSSPPLRRSKANLTHTFSPLDWTALRYFFKKQAMHATGSLPRSGITGIGME